MDCLLDARHDTSVTLALDNLAASRSAAAQSAKLKELACLACSCCSTSPNHKMSMMKSFVSSKPNAWQLTWTSDSTDNKKEAVVRIAAKLQPLHKADTLKVEPYSLGGFGC